MASYRRILCADGVKYTYGCNTSCAGTCIEDLCCTIIASPPPLSVDSTQIPVSVKSRLVPDLLIAAAAVLAAAFLLLIATYAVHRRRRRRLSVSPAAAAAAAAAADAASDHDVFDDGDTDHHHIWNIRTVGLDEATIRSIATSVYDSKDGLLGDGGAADCSVCLADIRDGELLRLLPKCGHAFHVPCIDTWLRSHQNCPLCRAPILAPPANPVDSPLPPAPPAIPSDLAATAEDTWIDVEEWEGDHMMPVEDTTIDRAVASSSELQPVRRSVSMDSVPLAALLLRAVPEERSIDKDWVIKNKGKQENAVKGAFSLQNGPREIGRSLSSRSGRVVLSRHGRGRSSVLPL